MRTRYARDPIVEAVLEARLTGGSWSTDVCARFVERLRADYPGEQQHRRDYTIDPTPQSIDEEALSMRGRLAQDMTLLPSGDGRRFVGVSRGVLTSHVLAPYPGWSEFVERFEQAFEAYVGETGAQGVTQVGLRYIDQITLPANADRILTDYFPFLPARPAAMPEHLDGFQITTQATERVEGFTSTLTMVTMPQDGEGRPVILYDLNLVHPFDGMATSFEKLRPHLEFLHQKQRDIFEDSITDRTRGLFS